MAPEASAHHDFWPCRTGGLSGETFASEHVGPSPDDGIWAWRPITSLDTPLLDAKGHIFVTMRGSAIMMWRLDLMTVARCFSFEHVTGTPALANGVLYAVSFMGVAAAFDVKTGNQRWKSEYCKHSSGDPFSVGLSGDVLVVPGNPEEHPPNTRAAPMCNMVYGLSTKDGRKLWEYKPGLIMVGQNFTPTFLDDRCVFMNSKADICCLNLKSGSEAWKVATPKISNSFGGASVGRNRVVYASANYPGKPQWNAPCGGKGAVRAYDFKTGTLKWETAFDLEANGVPSLLSTGPGGRLVLAVGLGATPGLPEGNPAGAAPTGDTWTAQVVGLDPETGDQLWATERCVHNSQGCRYSDVKKDLQVSAITNPVGSGDGTFYVVCQGILEHFNVEDGSRRARFDTFEAVQGNPVLGPGILVVTGNLSKTLVFRSQPPTQGKVIRPLDATLEETGTDHFWNAKHGPDMNNQGYTSKARGPRSLLKPAVFFKYTNLYAMSPHCPNDNLYNSPVVDSQRNVYAASNFSDLFIIRPDGRLRGSIYLGPLTSSPVLIGKACYICDGAGFAHSFDIETLEINWRKRYCTSNPWDSWAAAGKDNALIVGGNASFRPEGLQCLYRLDTSDGRTVWEYRYMGEEFGFMPYNMMPAITDDGRVITANNKGCVFCNSLEDGSLLWLGQNPYPEWAAQFTTATVTVGRNGLAANAWNKPLELRWNHSTGGGGRLDVYEISSGGKTWEKDYPMDINVAPLFVPPEVAVGSSGWQVIVCLGSNCGMPGDQDNVPVTGDCWKAVMLAHDAATGQEIWSWAPPPSRHYTFRGGYADDHYLPDAWTSVSSDSHGTIYGSFQDGVMYAVRGGQLISKLDMRSCGNCAPGLAPGMVAHMNQFGVIIWRDAELEEEWAASGDKRAGGGKRLGGAVPKTPATGAPWEEGDGRLEWREPRPWDEPKERATALERADYDAWLAETERWHRESILADLEWSEARKVERAAAVKQVGGQKAAAPGRPQKKAGSMWKVVGGSDKGIVVRSAEGLKSDELGRLANGATIEEVALKGERLQYKKLTGDGPQAGWVSLTFKNTPLVRRES